MLANFFVPILDDGWRFIAIFAAITFLAALTGAAWLFWPLLVLTLWIGTASTVVPALASEEGPVAAATVDAVQAPPASKLFDFFRNPRRLASRDEKRETTHERCTARG